MENQPMTKNYIFIKMKFVLILITLYATKCVSLRISEPIPPRYNIQIINILGTNQSILYYNENNNDVLINSILKEVYENQPVLLVSGENITIGAVNHKHPNIILLLETLNVADFETEVFKTLLFSHWSVLYLVITTKSENYTCDNGKLSESAFAETKNYLNDLWQMYHIIRVSLYFPYTCPMHCVIYEGKEESGADVYNRGIRLIKPKDYTNAIAYSGNPRYLTEGYPLRVNMFYRFPTSISECHVVTHYTNIHFGNKLCGMDGMVMHDFLQLYKYNVSEPDDDNCDTYGFIDITHNKTVGSLGCIVRGELDISFNSRFISLYTTEAYSYLHSISQDSLCVILKRARTVPLWHYAFNVFTVNVWMCLLLLLSLVGFVGWLSAIIKATISDEKPLKLYTYICHLIYAALFGMLLKNDGRLRVLKATSLLSSIMLLAIYQGHVNYQFTTRSYYRELKSLSQLYESPYVLYTTYSTIGLVENMEINNPIQKEFQKRIQLCEYATLEFLLDHPNSATVTRKEDVKIQVLQNYTDKLGMPLLYLIDECFQTYHLSYISKRGFIFHEESAKFMMRLTEAGLPNKYYIWSRNTFRFSNNWPPANAPPRAFKKIPLNKLRISFGVLLVGYIVSGLVFIVERWGKLPGGKSCNIFR